MAMFIFSKHKQAILTQNVINEKIYLIRIHYFIYYYFIYFIVIIVVIIIIIIILFVNMSITRNVGRLFPKQTALFICDIQGKFRNSIPYFNGILEISSRLLRGAHAFNMPVIASAQYPEKLGPVAEELELEKYGVKPYGKKIFSMMTPEMWDLMKTKHSNVKSVILCGLAAHVCVQTTAIDLLEKGYDLHVVADACSSEQMADRFLAFERMKQAGAWITTYEAVLLYPFDDLFICLIY